MQLRSSSRKRHVQFDRTRLACPGASTLQIRKLKPPRLDSERLTPLAPRPRTTTGMFVPWKTATPRDGEAVRWECVDGRWITVSLGHGAHAGEAMVCNAAGQHEYVDSFEMEALTVELSPPNREIESCFESVVRRIPLPKPTNKVARIDVHISVQGPVMPK